MQSEQRVQHVCSRHNVTASGKSGTEAVAQPLISKRAKENNSAFLAERKRGSSQQAEAI